MKVYAPLVCRIAREEKFDPVRDRSIILAVFCLVAGDLMLMENLNDVGMYLRREACDLE